MTGQAIHEASLAAGDILLNQASFVRHLRAVARPKTIETYTDAVKQLIGFLQETGGPTNLAHISREHVERFQVHLVDAGRKESTIHNRHRGLKSFFGWLAHEANMIEESPMARMKPPILPEVPTRI